MKNNKILGITIIPESKSTILEKIKKYINQPVGFFHIVSLNPENFVLANENDEFKKVVETSQIKLVDGIGVVLAGRLLNVEVRERLTGVEVMKMLIRLADETSSGVLLIGGRPNLALRLADCYQKKYPKLKISGIEGIKNIEKPAKNEEEVLFRIVADTKPNIIIAAFGSPAQELWLVRHADQFAHCVCIGVGGAFDFVSGKIHRAPKFLQKIGLEWLFRLFTQPWRWKRQLKLIKFGWLVLGEKIRS